MTALFNTLLPLADSRSHAYRLADPLHSASTTRLMCVCLSDLGAFGAASAFAFPMLVKRSRLLFLSEYVVYDFMTDIRMARINAENDHLYFVSLRIIIRVLKYGCRRCSVVGRIVGFKLISNFAYSTHHTCLTIHHVIYHASSSLKVYTL